MLCSLPPHPLPVLPAEVVPITSVSAHRQHLPPRISGQLQYRADGHQHLRLLATSRYQGRLPLAHLQPRPPPLHRFKYRFLHLQLLDVHVGLAHLYQLPHLLLSWSLHHHQVSLFLRGEEEEILLCILSDTSSGDSHIFRKGSHRNLFGWACDAIDLHSPLWISHHVDSLLRHIHHNRGGEFPAKTELGKDPTGLHQTPPHHP